MTRINEELYKKVLQKYAEELIKDETKGHPMTVVQYRNHKGQTILQSIKYRGKSTIYHIQRKTLDILQKSAIV